MPWSRIAAAVALWALLVGVVALEIAPALPATSRGWALLVVAGPLGYLALELLGEKLWSREAGLRISRRRFSWKRVFVALLAFLGLALLVAAALRF